MFRDQLRSLIASGSIEFDAGQKEVLQRQLLEDARWPLQKLAASLAAEAGPIRISSITAGGHARESHHYLGRAIDIGNEERAEAVISYLRGNAKELEIDELIFDAGVQRMDDRNAWNLKGGRPFAYPERILKGHADHIHVSVRPERAEREVFLAAAGRQTAASAPHEDPVRDGMMALAAADDGAPLAGVAARAFAAPDIAARGNGGTRAALDGAWAVSPSEPARLVLDAVAVGTKTPDTVRRALAMVFDRANGPDEEQLPGIIDALGPVVSAALTAPVERNLGKLGLDPASSAELLRFVTGSASPGDVALSVLRREARRHVPEKFAPILELGTALLAGSGSAGGASVLGAVFGGANQLSSMASLVGAGAMGAGLAIPGAIAVGMAIFSMAKRSNSDAQIRQALQEIKQDLAEIKQDLRELKKSVAEIRTELRAFSARTERNFERVLDALTEGLTVILDDTGAIRTRLGGIERDLDNVLEGLLRVERLQHLTIAVELQTARDQIDLRFGEVLESTFSIFREPRSTLTETAEIELRKSLAFFFKHATVAAFSAAMSLGSVEKIRIDGLDEAASLIRAAPSVEHAFGLLPRVLELLGLDVGSRRGEALEGEADALPNPVELVRGADAFMQLLLLAPPAIQAQYTDRLDALRAVAERIRRFTFALRYHLNTDERAEGPSALRRLSDFLSDARDEYRKQHQIGVPILRDASAFNLAISPKKELYQPRWYVDSKGQIVTMDLKGPDDWPGRDISGSDPVDVLVHHRLVTKEDTGQTLRASDLPGLPRGRAMTWSGSHDPGNRGPEEVRVYRLRTHPPAPTGTVLMLVYEPQAYGGGPTRAIFAVQSVSELGSASPTTETFLERCIAALPAWHAEHWAGLVEHMRQALAQDQSTIPGWEARQLASWLVHRVRLHNDRLVSDRVAARFMDAVDGGVLMTRADLLRWWEDHHRQITEADRWLVGGRYGQAELTFALEPASDGLLPLVEACTERLRGVAQLIDGAPRGTTQPTGRRPDLALAASPGDTLRLPGDAAWHYWTIEVREGTSLEAKLWTLIFSNIYGSMRDQFESAKVVFLDRDRKVLEQHEGSTEVGPIGLHRAYRHKAKATASITIASFSPPRMKTSIELSVSGLAAGYPGNRTK